MKALEIFSSMILPVILLITITIGLFKKVDIYSAFLEGAKEGLKTVAGIFPAVVTLMIGIGIFRSSGLLDFISNLFVPILDIFNIPKEILPMAILRPMSGSGGIAMLTDIVKNFGADSKAGIIASVICGSTETTFYTVAVYFGSVGITDVRHTIKCALIADLICIISGISICSLMLI